MSLPPLIRALIVFAIMADASFVRANEEFVFWASKIGGKKYESSPRWDWISGAPEWKPGQPLPISVDDAIAAAKKELDRYAVDSEKWGFYYVDLLSFRSGAKDKWYFLITFGAEPGGYLFPRAQIPVNMSGVANRLFRDSAAPSAKSGKFLSMEERLWERANKIFIPHVDFKEATLEDVLKFLREEAVKRDPKHLGIPIDAAQLKDLGITITVSLADISLAEALDYIARLASCLAFPNRTSLSVVPYTGPDLMMTHTIPLAGAPKSEIAKMRADPKEFLLARGIAFSAAASCSLADHGMTLVVKNTPEQLAQIREALASLEPHGAHERSAMQPSK